MKPIKIEKSIVEYSVLIDEPAAVTPAAEPAAAVIPVAESDPAPATETKSTADVIHMHEKVDRPEMLEGSTYKVKTPVSDHAMYVTINDIILNYGTEHEQRRPFEIFVNSKNLDHYQWIVALTRIISAVFRKGGDVTFLVDELKAVFDPRGGYWKAGGTYMPSIIAELGHVVETHLQKIGLLKSPEMDEHRKKLIAEKRAEYEENNRQKDAFAEEVYPAGAQLCVVCSTAAVVMMDGCQTCLSCGDSKCG
ncbi:MAG: NrdJb [Gammaproteobacteria bacterium]|nr:NrdJb [Gammaproteobacteria bacterium]